MAEGKKSFILYSDLMHNIDHLTNEEKGVLFNHLLEYVNDLNPILEDRVIVSAWKPIERQLKRDLVKFEGVKESRSKAGKISAELRAVKKAQQKSTNPTHVESVQHCSTNPTVSVNENENENENVILLEKETKEVFNEWLDYRKEIGKPIKSKATIQKLKEKMNAEGFEKTKLAVNQSITNGWQGLIWNKEKGSAQKENGLDILREFNRRAKENEHLNNYE